MKRDVENTSVLELLEKSGALIEKGHFIYTSGKHGSTYFNKDAIYPHTQLISRLCLEIAKHFEGHKIEVVIAPAIGGVILSQWVAFHLSQLTKKEVLGVYAEKEPHSDQFVIKRGYDRLCSGKRILVVEDVLTTGGSVKKVMEQVLKIPSKIVGLAVLCNRGNLKKEDIGNFTYFFSLTELCLEAWSEMDCPLCKNDIPINSDVGKGREYLKNRLTAS